MGQESTSQYLEADVVRRQRARELVEVVPRAAALVDVHQQDDAAACMAARSMAAAARLLQPRAQPPAVAAQRVPRAGRRWVGRRRPQPPRHLSAQGRERELPARCGARVLSHALPHVHFALASRAAATAAAAAAAAAAIVVFIVVVVVLRDLT